MSRSGTAELPLHGGQVPRWLAERMARLGRAIVEALVHHYGRDEVLRRLAHPLWFQALGCVMGMDWHSSLSEGALTPPDFDARVAAERDRSPGRGGHTNTGPAKKTEQSHHLGFRWRHRPLQNERSC